MPRIVSIGHITIDHTFRVEALPTTAVKTKALHYQAQCGGMAANAAVALAALGAEAVFIGPVGSDEAGQTALARLRERGVDVNCARVIAGESTSTSAVIVDSEGERLIVGARGTALRAPPVDEDLNALQGADLVMADVRWARGAEPLLRAARQRGIMTMVDGDVGEATDVSALMAYADIVAFSEPGLRQWAQTDDDAEGLQLARATGCHTAIVTHGARGVAWGDDQGLHALPGFAVDAVDTTGAGDTWHAAFAVGLVEGRSIDEAVRFANAAGALKVTRHGSWNVPTRAAIESFLGRQHDG